MSSSFLFLHNCTRNAIQPKSPVLINIDTISEIYPNISNDTSYSTIIFLNSASGDSGNWNQVNIKVMEKFEDILEILPVLPPITSKENKE